jgi:hypothetical protein
MLQSVKNVAMRAPGVFECEAGQFCLKSKYEYNQARVCWDFSVFSAFPMTTGQLRDCLSHIIIVSRSDGYMQIRNARMRPVRSERN